MKLGIDISQIVHQGTGVARFTNGLLNAILDNDTNNQWTFLFYSLRKNLDPQLEKKIKSKGHMLIKWKLPPTFASFLFNDLHELSKILTSNIKHLALLDWFVTSDWIEFPLSVKKAAIVHDLVYLRYPETAHSKIVSTQKKRLEWVKKESKIILADSESTKQDLEKFLGIDKNKIKVNYPGVEVDIPNPDRTEEILRKYGIKKPFILTVGKKEPRKNLGRLVKAFNNINNEQIELVIVGPTGWSNMDASNNRLVLSEVEGLIDTSSKNKIHHLGFVEDGELFALFKACLFFILPSIWEGFGYPVIEAMKLAVPVAVSNTSSLAEITQDAGLLFDPFKVEEIAQVMKKLSSDEDLRKQLAQKGLERSKLFMWESYFERMIKALKSNS
ncbi:hypothetical protein A2866_00740 [Candidatus Roizmanbacteria bacterium RIFCSPHIGHO2_01_FULL_39_8]|uniref:Glycosyl transferase family 1 domain-containing protein n=3 Tax=Candidatus Roizmaniibacteriota TaxID=1752723 RepID=A0A1F7GHU9_9BACT|nr:MAG: hypothetical protein A2866_00740 [Candidatus Roizmanbacteria bacterium RIFCSPHIGHO2_01_FULL_39_8]OGK27641.1 MAG: hypothetical protein A3C28_04835 [Candidatus Roizmanbacteria bacterium RIFCSPHIGHO2_02_FULL_39_9]OGK38101.1 MAG: hypothetical protein A3F60_00465 [Candidatus Roizmanbacteria bacterium RIFCSPHIGHO2_12_FULL_39_8]